MASLPADVNSYRDQDVRRALWPVAELAEESGAAVVFTRHPTKGGSGPAMYRGGGSVAITGVARAALFALKDPEDASGIKRLLAVSKCNGIPEPEKRSTRYEISSAIGRDQESGLEVEVGQVFWGAEDERTADALVRAADAGDAPDLADAADVISKALREGPLTARQLDELRRDSGIGINTWERVAHDVRSVMDNPNANRLARIDGR